MKIRYILTDIEGTTTSISFVKDVLFPYSYDHMRQWILEHGQEERVIKALERVKKTILDELGLEINDDQAIEKLRLWIQEDRKQPDLKAIQGWMWADGYKNGYYVSHVYPDVKPALERWKNSGLRLGVYSSGSVEAQKLLFGHTTKGNLLSFFSDFFDTRVGEKKSKNSYAQIASQLRLNPQEILFLSDIPEELDAAKSAGMQVTHLVRPGTEPVPRFPSAQDFASIP